MKSLNWKFGRNNKKARKFAPHNFKTKIELASSIPRVLISRLAYNKMWHYVDIANKEVSWLGIVKRDGEDFLIEDVSLLKQEVGDIETEITPDGLAEFGQEILSKPNGTEIYNNIRFWGHSHVNMGTAPSAQDENQMEQFKESECPFFIRGILNKNGRMEFTIFLYSAKIKIIDAEWTINEPVDETIRSKIETEFKEKVSEKVSMPPLRYQHSLYPYSLNSSYGQKSLPQTSIPTIPNRKGSKYKKGGKR